jgi:hypothetical protein
LRRSAASKLAEQPVTSPLPMLPSAPRARSTLPLPPRSIV